MAHKNVQRNLITAFLALITASPEPSDVISILKAIELFKVQERFSEDSRVQVANGFLNRFLVVFRQKLTGKLKFTKCFTVSLQNLEMHTITIGIYAFDYQVNVDRV